ncbi:MAG: two-component regulator propeller domain-containing protein [Dysgonamonadaceae bacterium]|nr:two-component regulator propeller domain-containing protein [Dysgonamonadaceae bacterium]
MKINNQSYFRALLLQVLLFNIIAVGFSSPSFQFRHFNINNGLSQNTVFSIYQDTQGFMWFGTKDGLNRFDGESFKIFRMSSENELKDNVFRSIVQDRDDRIWLGTDDGVYIYNPQFESFDFFNLKTSENDSISGLISHMIIDTDGDVWISALEKGVFMYDYETKLLDFYAIEITKGDLKGVTLCEDNGKGVWVLPYSRPINQIDKKRKKISEFRLKSNNSILYQTGEINKVIADGNNLLIGTSQLGLISIDVLNKSYNNILSLDRNGNAIFIRDILKIDNNVWIASETGLYFYNLYTGDLKNLSYNTSFSNSVSDNAIYSLCEDSEGGVWIGSYFGGVDYLPNKGTYFQNYYPVANEKSLSGLRVREFCMADESNIWIGTEDNGLNLFNFETSTFAGVHNSLKNLYSNIHALYQDDDFLWIGVFSKGLYRYNLKDKTLKTYRKTDSENSLIENSVFSIFKDTHNILWIETISGLNTYDYENDDFKQINHLDGVFIQDIMEDSDGNIWFATFLKGLYRLDPKTQNWTNFIHNSSNPNSLPYNKVTSVYEDKKKRIWITTEGGGFCQFNKKDESFTVIDCSSGLFNNVVYQVLEDDESNLWLSTNSGLIKYSPENGVMHNFTIHDGLKTNQFNYKSSLKTNDGTLYFGSIDGFVRFNPSSFIESNFVSPIVFTQLLINNFPEEISNGRTPLNKSIQHTDKLKLNHNQNSLSIKYAVLSFSENKNSGVLYKLEGYDKDWISVDNSRTISYSNLSSGKYTLLVTIPDTNQYKKLDIVIKPPFWFTLWAYVIYFLFFVSVIVFTREYINIRDQKNQRQKLQVFEQESERNLYKSKIEFFTNVAHEIRTPLSLIKAPLDEVLRNKNASNDIRGDLEIMSRNTDRLLGLTRQLLDFQKTESELYALDMEDYDIPQLVKDIVYLFTPLSKLKGISLDLENTDSSIIAKIDREAFTKIISNLISNALKYGEKLVSCEVSCFEIDNESFVEFLIKNDGSLIPESFQESIFKPFIQISKNKNETFSGTGIGLALSKSLTTLMNGKINYKVLDGLNVFSVSFPAEKKGVNLLEKSEALTDCDLTNGLNNNKKRTKQSLSVLIVEDDNDLNEFLKRCLSDKYRVLQASDGEQALEVIKAENVNIIVSDIMMPIVDGYELIEKVKSNIETSHIPVILLTAKTNNKAKIEGYVKGADMYIDKPFSIEVLQAQIANLLESRETLRESFMNNPFIGAVTVAVTQSDVAFINKLNVIIQDNISDSAFNVEDMAEQFNMSRASFYRKIRGVLDLTPNEYIRIERLKKGAQLLKERNYKVNEICYMIGFNSPSYFAKCFQQQFGVLPKDFQDK